MLIARCFRIAATVLALSTLMAWLSSCHRAPRVEERHFSGDTQGTTYSIKVCAERISAEQEAAIRKAIETRLEEIDKALSNYRPDSEISRFNQFAEITPFKVSADVIQVLQLAREVSIASEGAFDVTVAPLVKAWGFGPAGRRANDPTEEELAEIRKRVGYEKVEIDGVASTLRKTQPDVTCDLNAIAQGYTSDKLADDLDGLGYTNYMIEVGGEVKTRGLNARGLPWHIGIEKPITTDHVVDLVVQLEDIAISTSGDYRNYYEENGVRISHHVDPRTGRPITHPLASVSVIDKQCARADAYATAFTVLGPDAGYQLALKHNLPVLFIIHTGSETFAGKTTPSFDRFIMK